jgi:hypothetical protein
MYIMTNKISKTAAASKLRLISANPLAGYRVNSINNMATPSITWPPNINNMATQNCWLNNEQ